MLKIAVVILNWNGKSLLEKFLPSVVKYSTQATVYMVDNASEDDSIRWAQSHYPEVRIIKNKKNEGYAKGYNTALKQIKSDIFCLLNSDVEVTENWLSPILNIFEKNQNIAAIQPKILWKKQPEFFEYAGAAGGFIDKYGFPFCRGRIFNTLEKDHHQYNKNTRIFWASGACLFIRSNEYWDAGGLDEDFFAHQEEIDLCWRIYRRDKEILFCHESTVYHLGGATLSAENPRKTYLNFRNSLFMLVKNLPTSKLIPIIFVRMCMDGVAAIHFLTKGKPKLLWAVFKAHISFYKKLMYFYKKRKGIYRNDYAYVKSIAWKYFVKNKKHFSNI